MATESQTYPLPKRAMAASHSLAPVPKVAASGMAGALATILVWVLQQTMDVTMPPEVVAAMTTILMFGAGYMVRAAEAAAPPE